MSNLPAYLQKMVAAVKQGGATPWQDLGEQLTQVLDRNVTATEPVVPDPTPAPVVASLDKPAQVEEQAPVETAGPKSEPQNKNTPLVECEDLLRVVEMLDRQSLLSGQSLNRTKENDSVALRILQEENRKIVSWDDMAGRPAADWLNDSLRGCMRDIVGRSRPLSPLEDFALNESKPLALLQALRRLRPRNHLELIERKAIQAGHRVEITEGARNHYSKTVEQHAHHDRLLGWLKAHGLPSEQYHQILQHALESLPETREWMAGVRQTLIEQRDNPRLAHPAEPSIFEALLLENPKVFELVPKALNEHQQSLSHSKAAMLDMHYPAQMLYALATVRQVRQTNDQNVIFADYLALLPNVGEELTRNQRAGRDRVYRNLGWLALGGIPQLSQAVDQGSRSMLGTLLDDLVKKDLCPVVEGKAEHNEQTRARFKELRFFLHKQLVHEPEMIGESLRFLTGARSDDAQIRMIGMHLAAQPYRTLLLRPGPLCVRTLLDPGFDKFYHRAHRDRPAPSVAGVSFSEEDRASVRQKALEARWADNAAVSRIIPVLVWLQQEGDRLVQQSLEVDASLISQTRERMAMLPSVAQRDSLAAMCLGVMHQGPDLECFRAIQDNPATMAYYLINATNTLAIDPPSHCTSASALVGHPHWDGAEAASVSLQNLAEKWTGETRQWQELFQIMEQPALQMVQPREVISEVQSRLIGSFGLDPDKTPPIPQLAYSAEERKNLTAVLSHPWTQQALFTPGQPDPDNILLAACLDNQGHLIEPSVWRPHLQRLERECKEYSAVTFDALPGVPHSRSFTLKEWTPAALEEGTRKVFGCRGSLESLGQPQTTARDNQHWLTPQKWADTLSDLRFRETQMRRLLGAGGNLDQLPRLLQFMAGVHSDHGTLFSRASGLAERVLGHTAAPDLGAIHAEMAKLLDQHRGLDAKLVITGPSPLRAEQPAIPTQNPLSLPEIS